MKDIDILCQNAIDVIDRPDLEARLKEGKPLRVKAGFDPSAPDIHLGHAVLLRKLRQFQDMGHKVILIIGDSTAKIGDPTGQSKTRPILTTEQVEANAKTYQEQAFKILDKNPAKIEVVQNSKWLDTPEMLKTFISISGCVTVDQLLVRDDFDKRRNAHRPIQLQELFYPIMQGYDSVAVKADAELGGTDQLFNLLMGREIQSLYKMKPQIVMTLPLLVGLDGTMKMSKSLGNYIAVNDTSKDVFGKAMSIPDALMQSYYDLLTDQKFDKTAHPKEAKVKLAKTLTEFLHGQKAADAEAAEFDRIFRDKQNPTDIPKKNLLIHNRKEWGIVDLLKATAMVSSGSDARRLIEQGAVSVDGNKIMDPNAIVHVKTGSIVKVGPKRFADLIID